MVGNNHLVETSRKVNDLSSLPPTIPKKYSATSWVNSRILQISEGLKDSEYLLNRVEILGDKSRLTEIDTLYLKNYFHVDIVLTELNPYDKSSPYHGDATSYILNIFTNDPILDILIRPALGYIYNEAVTAEELATRFTLQQIDGLDAETAKEVSKLLFLNKIDN